MNKDKKIKMVALLCFSITILSVSLVAIKAVNQNTSNDYHQKLELEENAKAYEGLIYTTKNIVLPGWSELSIVANCLNQRSGIDFYNPESNLFYRCPKCLNCIDNNTCDKCKEEFQDDELIEDMYYLTFKLVLDDTGEILYQSKLVYPGLHIQSIELSKELEEGDYQASVLMDVYGKDMYTQFNSGEVKLILHSKKRI